MKKKCDHLKEALELWKKQKLEYREPTYPLANFIPPIPHLCKYSSVRILYETKKGRVVNCYMCGETWYTQAEYSKYLSMQR